MPYLIAAAIVHGRVGISEVADIGNSLVLDLAARIAGISAEHQTSGITIHMRGGRTATARLGLPLGSPENRLNVEQLTMKFADCARHAVRPLSNEAVHAAIQMIRHLEEVPTVNDLLRYFA